MQKATDKLNNTVSITNSTSSRVLQRVLHRKADDQLRNEGADLRLNDSPTSTLDVGASHVWNTDDGRLERVTAHFPAADRHFDHLYTPGAIHLLDTITGPAHSVTRTYESTRDALQTISNATNDLTPQLISQYTYRVNDIGQRDDVETEGSAFGNHPAEWTWGYHALGHLVSAKHENDSGHARYYAYDDMGNRTESRTGTDTASGGDITTYGRDNLNQYTDIDPPTAAAFEPEYDVDGNMERGIIPIAPDKPSALIWDGRNQLVSVHQIQQEELEEGDHYSYDAYGRRFMKIVAIQEVREYFIYDGWNLIAQYEHQGVGDEQGEGGGESPPVIKRTYVWGLDLSGTFQGAGGVGGLLAMRNTDGQIYYPTYDGNGNVSEYLDESGDDVAHMQYDPFGNLLPTSTGAHADFPHKFSTKYTDPETGLLYYGYRYFDPVTGRWPSRDPIGEWGGLNMYGFVRNNPLYWYDYLGLDPHPVQPITNQPDSKWDPNWGWGNIEGWNSRGNCIRHATDDPLPQGTPYDEKNPGAHNKPFPGFANTAADNSCEKIIQNALNAGARRPDEKEDSDCKCPEGYNYTAIHFMPRHDKDPLDDVHVDRYNCAGQPNPKWWRKMGGNAAINATGIPVEGKPFGEDLTNPQAQPPSGYRFCGYLCLKSATK